MRGVADALDRRRARHSTDEKKPAVAAGSIPLSLESLKEETISS
jgi:hypothetical protein